MWGRRISLNLPTFSTFCTCNCISAFPQNRQSTRAVNPNWQVSHSENIPSTSNQQSIEEYLRQLKEVLLLVNNFEFIARSEFDADQTNLQKF